MGTLRLQSYKLQIYMRSVCRDAKQFKQIVCSIILLLLDSVHFKVQLPNETHCYTVQPAGTCSIFTLAR